MIDQQVAQPDNTVVDKAQGLKFLYQMTLIRRFEEKSAEMYTREKIRGFLHLYIGEEAVATGVINVLKKEDNILCTYREHGQALVRGVDPSGIMAEMYGKQEGCSKGRGGSMHLFDTTHRFYGGNAIVAGHLPMAVGMALADRKMNRRQITCCFFGEGAVAEGEFHEAMNLSSLWKLPVLWVCENNLYAMGTALRYTHAIPDLEKKAAGYGMDSASVDGMDLIAVLKTAEAGAETVRQTGRPFFLVCNTYRFRAHSMFDAELYREKTEVEEWKKKDPIRRFASFLAEQSLMTAEEQKEIEMRVEADVEKAVAFAEAGTWEPVTDLTKFVYTQSK